MASIRETILGAAERSGQTSGTPHGQSGSRAQRRRKSQRRAPSVPTAASSPGTTKKNTTTLRKRVPSKGATNSAVKAFAKAASAQAKTTPIPARRDQQALQRGHEQTSKTKLMAQTYKEGNEGRLDQHTEQQLAKSRLWVARGRGSGSKLVNKAVALAGAEGKTVASAGGAKPKPEPLDYRAVRGGQKHPKSGAATPIPAKAKAATVNTAMGTFQAPKTPLRKKASAKQDTPANAPSFRGDKQPGYHESQSSTKDNVTSLVKRKPVLSRRDQGDSGKKDQLASGPTTSYKTGATAHGDRAPRPQQALSETASGVVKLSSLVAGDSFDDPQYGRYEWDGAKFIKRQIPKVPVRVAASPAGSLRQTVAGKAHTQSGNARAPTKGKTWLGGKTSVGVSAAKKGIGENIGPSAPKSSSSSSSKNPFRKSGGSQREAENWKRWNAMHGGGSSSGSGSGYSPGGVTAKKKGIGSKRGSVKGVSNVKSSDRRLKENIVKLPHNNGVPWYQFTYRDDPDKIVHEGTMAQDLLEMPALMHAVGWEHGAYTVDYGQLPIN